MTLRHLNIFITVCKKMSITAAAEVLNMTQPAVSIAIKELEAFYSSKLFNRVNKKIYLTEPGKMLLQYAENILLNFNRSISDLRSTQNEKKLCLGMTDGFAQLYSKDIIDHVKQAIPDITLTIKIADSNQLHIMLLSSDIDIAVSDQTDFCKEFLSFRLKEEKLVLVSNNFYENASDKSNIPIILPHEYSAVKLTDYLIPVVSGTSIKTALELALSGMGAALLPLSLIKDFPGICEHCFSQFSAEIKYHIVFGNKTSPICRDAVEIIKSMF